MAIDHGLQGKNNIKSKRRRDNKSRKISAIAKAAVNKNGEILFNEASRAEWLTGFRKRKMERRKYGVAMQIIKDKKKLKDKNKARKASLHQNSSSKEFSASSTDSETDISNENCAKLDQNNGVIFDDDATCGMFGSSVSVVLDDTICENESDSLQFSKESSNKKNFTNPRDSLFKKALQKAATSIHNKRGNKNSKGKRKQQGPDVSSSRKGRRR